MGLEKCPYFFVLRLVPVFGGTLLCVMASGTVLQGWCYKSVDLVSHKEKNTEILFQHIHLLRKKLYL